MSKMTKRFLALFLAVLMFSSNAVGVLAEVVPETEPAKETGETAETVAGTPDTYELDPATLHVKKLGETDAAEEEEAEEPAPLYGLNDLVRVSIVLDQPSTLDMGYATSSIGKGSSADAYREGLKKQQQNVTNAINAKVSTPLDVKWNLTLTVNIISANVRYRDIPVIGMVDGVKDVFIENRYEPEQDSAAEPNTVSTSAGMTGATGAWAEGYTGAGSRIAIIDTGLHYEHQSFSADALEYSLSQMDSAPALMTAADIPSNSLNGQGIYFNSKVPYGYNYVDRDTRITHVEDRQGEHGSHVAGIAAANRYVKVNGEYVDAASNVWAVGMAPDAQLLIMKVFGSGGGAYDSDYMSAIEDALVMQCDSVNLSLGSGAPGWTYSDGYQDVMNKLTNSEFNTKTVVTISAGNSGASTDAMQTDLFIGDVNMHTGGSPGTFINSLCVASADNIGTIGAPLIFNGNQDVYYTETESPNGAAMASIAGTYDFVYIRCLGAAEDYAAVNAVEPLSGKFVMVDRGDLSFVEKGNNAKDYNPKAVVIANNQPGTINMSLDDYTGTAPMVCITLADAQKIIANSEAHTAGSYTYYTGSVEVSNKVGPAIIKDRAEAEMSSFSSWGVPGSLIMKPEIVTPGGNIYSVHGYNTDQNGNINGGVDQYEFMSGTSMAAPHMAGLAAVMSEYMAKNDLRAKNSGLSAYSDRAIKQSLMMSTATPMLDSNDDYISILQQGSGLADVQKAVDARSVIFVDGDMLTKATGAAADGKVKVEFGDDPDKKGGYTYSLTAYNLTDEDIEYELRTDMFTQSLYQYAGFLFMDQATMKFEDLGIPFNVSYDFTNPTQVSHDVDMDGDTDGDDAQAILDYLTFFRRGDDLDLEAGEMDGDGTLTTYDAYLLLKRGTNASDGFVVPANGSNTVTVTILLPTEISALEEYFPNGFYIEGFTYLSNKYQTEEGESVVEEHSVPMLAFYGSWTDPSMFDNTSLTDLYYGTDKLPYSGQSQTNYMTVVQNGVTTPFLGNPYMVEEEFPYDRLAISGNTTIAKIYYNLIRFAGTSGIAVSEVDKPYGDVGEVLVSTVTANNEEALYYHVNQATWYNTGTKSVSLGFKPSELGLAEGEVFRVGYYAIPEYYAMMMSEDMTDEFAGVLPDNAAFEKLLKSNVLGRGAFVGYDLTVDNTVPTLETPVLNGNMLDVSAADNINLAYVAVLSLDGQTVYMETAPGAEDYSDSVDVTQAIAEANGFVAVFAADYAGNEVALAVRVNDNGGDLDPGAVTGVTLTPESLDLYKGNEEDLIAKVIPLTAEDRRLTWTSSDENVAVVNENGHVTAVGAGTATITVTSVSNPAASATSTVRVLSLNTELNAIVWNADGEVFFSKFNASGLPEWNKQHNDPTGVYLHSAFAQSTGLFAADLDTSAMTSVFYQVDPETFEVTELGNLGVGAGDMANGPSYYVQDGNAFMQTYAYFLVLAVGDPEALDYMYAYKNLSNTLGNNVFLAGVAAKSLTATSGTYYLLDELGRIWSITLTGKTGSAPTLGNPKLIMNTGIETSFAYQSLYCDGTYLYWTHTDTAKNVAELIIIDPNAKKVYHAGDFGTGVWPAAGLYDENSLGTTAVGEETEYTGELISVSEIPVTEEIRARYEAEYTKGNVTATSPEEPAEEPAPAEEPVEEPAPEEEPVEEPAPEEEPVEEPAPEEEPVEEPTPEEEPVEEPAPEEEPVEEPAPEEEPANPVTGGTDAAGTVKKAERPDAAKEERPGLDPMIVMPIGEDNDPSRPVFVIEEDMTTNGLYEFTYDPNYMAGVMLDTELSYTSFYDDGIGTIKFAFARDPHENEGEMPLLMTFEGKSCTTAEGSGEVTAKTVELGNRFDYENGLESVTFTVGPNHVWGDVSYVWDGTSSVTATRTCQAHAEVVETETVAATSEVTKPATCTEEGEITYTAVFTNPAFATQTKTESIEALGHDFGEPVWTWAEDYSSATATFTCSHDATHTYSFDCPVESEVQEDGSVVHTARVLFNGKVYEDTVTEAAPGINVTSTDSSDGILLTWNEVSGAVGYNVYDAATGKLLGTATEPTFMDATTKSRPHLMGETYRFTVEAFDVHGNVLVAGDHEDMFNPFTDVEDDRPSFDYIAWAYNNDIVKGSLGDDGLRYFEPEGSTTRMNFVMILYKMHGSPKVSGKNPFKDVTGSKSIKAVLWAYNKGLVKGTDKTHFSPDVNLSRMNIIMILYKLAGSPKVSGDNPFEDISGSKTIKAVLWAVKKKIITGVDDTHFDPDGDCSRELFVEVLYKYNKIYKILK